MSLFRNRIFYYLILVIGVSAITYYAIQTKNTHSVQVNTTFPKSHNESHSPAKTINEGSQTVQKNAEIPPYVMEVLDYVLKNQKAPSRYVGGRIFENREQRLNLYDSKGDRIQYREWDVHPKTKGENRGAERLITGSDHTAYYTFDHYQTFIKIKL